MKKINLLYIIKVLLIKIKSTYFCLKYLPFKQAIKIPICIGLDFHVTKLTKGGILIKSERCQHSMITFGLGGTQGVVSKRGELYIENSGQLIFKGKASIGSGCSIRVDKNANLTIGEDMITLNKNSFIRCSHKITIGKQALIGWNVTINDTDGHYIIDNEQRKANYGAIEIGDHVWIGAHSIVSKNTKILNNSVVAQGSVVTKQFPQENVLIAGVPAKIIKENVNWQQ